MQWLRKFLSGASKRPTKATRRTFRPTLETLDQRDLPSVSSVLTASGQTQFIVDNTNSLIVKSASFGTATVIQGTTTTGVRTAQGFRTAGGTLGFDAVMLDGTLRHFEQSGPTLLPTGNYTAASFGLSGKILDAATAYDSQGRLRFDILTTSPGNTSLALDQTGVLFEFNQATGGGLTNTNLPNVRWVSLYLDTLGGTGIAVGQTFRSTTTVPDELLVRKADSVSGLSVLYDGNDSVTAAITDYSQTVSPITNVGSLPGFPGSGTVNSANSRVIVDLTFNGDVSLTTTGTGGTYALEYSVTTSSSASPIVNVLGVGVANDNIKPGG